MNSWNESMRIRIISYRAVSDHFNYTIINDQLDKR